MTPQQTDSVHDRRIRRRSADPKFRTEYERQLRSTQAVDDLIRSLEELREANGISKAEIARIIDKNPASVRRLLTASGNPELKSVVEVAEALGAEVKIVPREKPRRRFTTSLASLAK